MRYRRDGDLARVQRQQKFIAAAVKELIKPANLLRINKLYRIFNESVQTNVPVRVGLRYISMLKSLHGDKIITHTVAGSDVWIRGIYYYEPDMAKLEELVETYFYSDIDVGENQKVKVRVCIGNGNQASAEEVARVLRKQGFTVLKLDLAARSDYQVSQVISGQSQTEAAMAVANVLSIHEVLLDKQLGDEVDVVVIVGKDMLP